MPPTHGPLESDDRWVSLGHGTASLPEKLLLAHGQGRVLFITGAGTSVPSGLPDFETLVLQVYERLDTALHDQLVHPPASRPIPIPALSTQQRAEMERFDRRDFDVVLGMLERRMDEHSDQSQVRGAVYDVLRQVRSENNDWVPPRPSSLHQALVKLADRGTARTIITTNFDTLLQRAKAKGSSSLATHTLGGMPRPTHRPEFSGVMHIHGVLPSITEKHSEIVVTDRDFGEFYLRRRVVPDFIYDAARLFSLVLVGYSANDAPMRYLLNAVAADGVRFSDLKERYAFVGTNGSSEKIEVELEDWKGRGITPIPYADSNKHAQLAATLGRWAELSPINGKERAVDSTIKRIVANSRSSTPQEDRDLFDYLYRRGSSVERGRIAELPSVRSASRDWLTAMSSIDRELSAVSN